MSQRWLLLAIGNNHLRAGRASPLSGFARIGHGERRRGIVKRIEFGFWSCFTVTKIKSPPGSVRAVRGFFMPDRHDLADRCNALVFIFFGIEVTSELSLGLLAVAVTADGFNIMHASIADRWFFGEFAFTLIIPDRAGAATRHQACHAVVCALQPDVVIIFTDQATVFLIRYAFGHVITYSDGAKSGDPVSNFASFLSVFLVLAVWSKSVDDLNSKTVDKLAVRHWQLGLENCPEQCSWSI